LTAGLKSGAPNSATELTLEFNGELYKAGAPLPADEVVTSLFGKSGTVTVTSAKVGSDKKTVIFVLSGTVDKDTIIPATSATVTSSTGEAWKGLVTFSTSAWGITTP
jgi:hypothetical protein